MIRGSCHCGAVSFTYPRKPEWLTACNCSICRRLAAHWAYAEEDEIGLFMAIDATDTYIQGDKTLAIHRCKTCGCTTHWKGLDAMAGGRMAVNMRLVSPADVAGIRIRRFDGADTWEYLD